MQADARVAKFVIAVFLLSGLAAVSAAEPGKGPLFREATDAFEAAQSARASFFAPKTYAKAVKHYREAEQMFRGNRATAEIHAELGLAIEHFQKAEQTSKTAQTKLASPLKARTDAEKVKAPLYASELWERAERTLSRAISELERDAPDTAAQRAAEADQLYRDAELATIKRNSLGEVRRALAQAEQAKVDRYAPKTLQKAKDLLAQAESALEKNRYDADLPRSLVQQATYEVKHATYLAKVIKRARDEKQNVEDLILEWETPLRQIAAAVDIRADFESGYEEPAKKIITYVENQQDRSQRLQQQNNDLVAEIEQLQRALSAASEERTTLATRLQAQNQRREALEQQVGSLQAEIDRLQRNLGGASEERVAISDQLEAQTRLRENLQVEASSLRREIQVLEQMLNNVSEERLLLEKRLEAQARMRDQLAQVENMFSRDEARVLRQSNDIIIRLVGLSFLVGRSTIQPENFQLLAKVTEAVRAFPGGGLTIEGHTDSHGSDAANLTLSQKRAEAVKEYLVANTGMDASKIEALGYGETRPVANNETEEGRAKNRRIDVVIRPN